MANPVDELDRLTAERDAAKARLADLQQKVKLARAAVVEFTRQQKESARISAGGKTGVQISRAASDRAAEALRLRQSGMTFASIGQHYGISAPAARQIVLRGERRQR